VEKMIREEEELDDLFISEIAQEMDKREKEEEDQETNKKKAAELNTEDDKKI